jgi:hypothetical protein
MIATVIAMFATAAAAAYWFISQRRPPSATRAPQTRTAQPASAKAGGRFGGVEIRTRSSACRAAHALVGKRFLSKNAPTLPLPNCAAEQCSCTFSKLADRRTEGRRLDHGGLSASLFVASNRRSRQDRRRATSASQQR